MQWRHMKKTGRRMGQASGMGHNLKVCIPSLSGTTHLGCGMLARHSVRQELRLLHAALREIL